MKRRWLWTGAALLALAFLYLPALGVSGTQIFWFLLLLLCPLMHFLGGHAHGTHGREDAGEAGPVVGQRETAPKREEP